MKIIEPSTELILEKDNLKLIERAGRLCYKSEGSIGEGTAERFVRSLIKREHYAMLEHSNIIIKCSDKAYVNLSVSENVSYLRFDTSNYCYVSGSFRAWRDFIVEDFETRSPIFRKTSIACELLHVFYKAYPLVFEDIVRAYEIDLLTHTDFDGEVLVVDSDSLANLPLKDYIKMAHINHTVHFVCDRGVTHELVRHRNCAFAQESTRYCNYASGKFGNSLTFINPPFFKVGTDNRLRFEYVCSQTERTYNCMIGDGATPQEARAVLPNAVKTEIIVTASEKEWQHILNLRLHGTTGEPHPQIRQSMQLVYDDLVRVSEGRLA